MKTIGLLGGMSWESTALYYRLINEETRRRLGGLHSAPIALVSVDFQEIEALQAAGDWETAAESLAGAAKRVERAGADFILICTNTMHRVADEVAASIDIPLLHLADATAVFNFDTTNDIDDVTYERIDVLGSGGIPVEVVPLSRGHVLVQGQEAGENIMDTNIRTGFKTYWHEVYE